MTTWKQLSRPLRLAIAAPSLTLAALAVIAATPATRVLLLDSDDHPTANVSLASPHWIDTLDIGRLPPSVPLLDSVGGLGLGGEGGTYLSAAGLFLGAYVAVTPDGNATLAGSVTVGGDLACGELHFAGQFAAEETVAPTHTLTVYDQSGNAYKILCAE